MNKVTLSRDYQITNPSDNICEGEVELAAVGDIESALIDFARALMYAVIHDGSGKPTLSSFTFERLQEEVTGAIYGQAYFERRGNTLHHLRYRMLDSSGARVASGMGTTHLKGR